MHGKSVIRRWQNTLCHQGVQSFVLVMVCDKWVPSLITLPLYQIHQRSDLMLLELVSVVHVHQVPGK